MIQLSELYLRQWQAIRQMTYDYLDMLQPAALSLRLPFPESQSLLSQFRCMVGAHESYLKELQYGTWQGFSSSIDGVDNITPEAIKEHMWRSDASMIHLLDNINLTKKLPNGKYGYAVVQTMIEHEMHHHGQLINFMFCHHLPIPESWHHKWDLSR